VTIAWTPVALADRDAIFDYIEADSPRAAISIDEHIEAALERLVDFPESSRPGRVEGTRKIVKKNALYILPYRVLDDRVWILRAQHGAQLWPDKLSSDE
jgi:addiction module RelE/StbE family toxin